MGQIWLYVVRTFNKASCTTGGINFVVCCYCCLQLWCQVATPLRQAQQLAVDVHSPDPIRYINNVLTLYSTIRERCRPVGALTNSPEFAAAFDCPVGSPMNPANKCELY